MARGINKVILVGTLGRDPEMKYTASGTAIVNVSIATSEKWNDKQTGEKVEKTEWHRVVAFKRLAEIMGEYLRKGSQVYIEGKLQTRKWQDQNGQDRYTTEIVASQMQMLGGGNDPRGSSTGNSETSRQSGFRKSEGDSGFRKPASDQKPVTNDDFVDDDIPF